MLRRTLRYPAAVVATIAMLGNLIVTVIALVLVMVVALLLGFDPSASWVEWLTVAGLLVVITPSVIWLAVALGLVSSNVESASNLPLPLMLLPFLGGGFVPTGSMPPAMGWFAEHQPFTPIINTVRGLLLGTAIGTDGMMAVVWSVGMGSSDTCGPSACTTGTRYGSQGLLVHHVPLEAMSGWHHHGDTLTIGYVVQGELRFEYGPGADTASASGWATASWSRRTPSIAKATSRTGALRCSPHLHHLSCETHCASLY